MYEVPFQRSWRRSMRRPLAVKVSAMAIQFYGNTDKFFRGIATAKVRSGSTKGGGDGVELGAWYAVLNPDKLAVEGFKNSTGGG